MKEPVEHPCAPRRAFLSDMARLAAAGVVTGWMPAHTLAAHAAGCGAVPPNFPAGMALYRQAFRNWSGEIAVQDVWTAAPRCAEDVVAIANWAAATGYRIRPRGYMHNWSPLTLAAGVPSPKVVLLDTTRALTAVRIDTSRTPARVTAQAGVSLETLLAALEQRGLGLTAAPAPGDITLGGALAIAAHGTAVPAVGETRQPGHSYGTLSNLVVSLRAVVYDERSGSYGLRTFQRDEPEMAALLASLGRTFLVEATLVAGPNQRLRCTSHVDIDASELFAGPGSRGRTLTSFLDASGRVEAIWFPFTPCPWLKVWTPTPRKPLLARHVTHPFNYSFSDSLPRELSDLVKRIVIGGERHLTPLFGQTQMGLTIIGLGLTGSMDIWGWSRNLLQYIRPSTLRVTANGYAVLTRRRDVQRVISEFVQFYQNRVAAYRARREFPMNGPVEIRVTGLDTPVDVGTGAVQPALSPVRPSAAHAQWDVAVWFDLLTLPGTRNATPFYREIEQWMLANYTGDYATVRPEWSKGWAYGDTTAWQDETMIGDTIPRLFREGQPDDTWDTTRRTLDRLDRARIFTSPLLDRLLP